MSESESKGEERKQKTKNRLQKESMLRICKELVIEIEHISKLQRKQTIKFTNSGSHYTRPCFSSADPRVEKTTTLFNNQFNVQILYSHFFLPAAKIGHQIT